MILIGSGYAGLDPISKKFKYGDEACIVPDAQFSLVYLYTRVIPGNDGGIAGMTRF